MRFTDDQQFAADVFPSELEEIRKRRERMGQPLPDATGGPSAAKGLVGLALSGGGIRSASESLGVLQVLAAKGVLPRVDYVSTVSGGGLIGSTLSSLLNSPAASSENDRFPLGFEPGTVERPAVRYLRNHDRYLAPGGMLDAIRLPATVLRGIVNNLALLVPVLVAAVFLTELLFVLFYRWGLDRLRLLPMAVIGVFVLLAVLQPVFYRLLSGHFTWARRNRYGHTLSASLLASLAAVVCVPLFYVVQQAIDLTWADVGAVLNRYLMVFWIALGAIVLLTLVGMASNSFRKLTGKMSLLALGLFGYGIVFGLYFLLTLYQVESPVLDPALRDDLNSGQVTLRLQTAFEAKGHPIDLDAAIQHDHRGEYEWWVISDPSGTETVIEWREELRLTNTLLWDGSGEWWFLGIGIIGLVYALWLTNPNVTSQHAFFRDRLSRAFIFSVEPEGDVEPTDDLKLSALNAEGSTAPYHLVNTTLNLQGEVDPHLAGRNADFFVFSRHWVGGPTTGYCRTEDIEHYDRQMNLGTAMAISGAGLSPNMGTETVRSLVFLLTLLDLRLDYWSPNPEAVRRLGDRRLGMLTPLGPAALLREAFGWINANGNYVNVSDGGHLENLAVYELLRRRCRTIISVDASEDPTMSFEGLVILLRYARIDLGINIDINMDPLRPGPDGKTKAHWVAGDIHYGGGETGRLIYVKSSLTGDEPEAILAYHSTHPTFPQETSANQFFTESQFEAYRALGEHMAMGLCDSEEGLERPVFRPAE